MIPLHDETASLTPIYDEHMMRSAENTTCPKLRLSIPKMCHEPIAFAQPGRSPVNIRENERKEK